MEIPGNQLDRQRPGGGSEAPAEEEVQTSTVGHNMEEVVGQSVRHTLQPDWDIMESVIPSRWRLCDSEGRADAEEHVNEARQMRI